MAKAAQSLAADGINILAVSQTTRQTNMQFIVERDKFAQAQRALHAALCK
jgi:aspartate kinase